MWGPSAEASPSTEDPQSGIVHASGGANTAVTTGATIIPAYQYVTAAERDARLALRKSGFNKRFAPYPQA